MTIVEAALMDRLRLPSEGKGCRQWAALQRFFILAGCEKDAKFSSHAAQGRGKDSQADDFEKAPALRYEHAAKVLLGGG